MQVELLKSYTQSLAHHPRTDPSSSQSRINDDRSKVRGIRLCPDSTEADLSNGRLRTFSHRDKLHSSEPPFADLRQEKPRKLGLIEWKLKIPRAAPLNHLFVTCNPQKKELEILS